MTHFRSSLARKSKPVQRVAMLDRAILGLRTVSGSPRVLNSWLQYFSLLHAAFRYSWALENWEVLISLLSASPPLHRAYDQEILIWFGFQLYVFPFRGSKDLTWPLFASVFSSVKWTHFHLFHLLYNTVIKSYQLTTHESTLQHKEFMKIINY